MQKWRSYLPTYETVRNKEDMSEEEGVKQLENLIWKIENITTNKEELVDVIFTFNIRAAGDVTKRNKILWQERLVVHIYKINFNITGFETYILQK